MSGAARRNAAMQDLTPLAYAGAMAATSASVTVVPVDTPHGTANAHLHLTDRPQAALVLGHGAAGGIASGDLKAVTDVALSDGISVALVEQPYRVLGRRSPAPRAAARRCVGGRRRAPDERRAGAVAAHRRRSIARRAGRVPHGGGDRRDSGAVPRVPTAAASRSRTAPGTEPAGRARRGGRPDPGRARRQGPVRHSAGHGASHRGGSAGRPQPADRPGRGGRGGARLASRRPGFVLNAPKMIREPGRPGSLVSVRCLSRPRDRTRARRPPRAARARRAGSASARRRFRLRR